jgi:hypothetical protein
MITLSCWFNVMCFIVSSLLVLIIVVISTATCMPENIFSYDDTYNLENNAGSGPDTHDNGEYAVSLP